MSHHDQGLRRTHGEALAHEIERCGYGSWRLWIFSLLFLARSPAHAILGVLSMFKSLGVFH